MTNLKLYFEGNDNTSEFFKNNVTHIDSDIDNCDYIISSSFETGMPNRKVIQKALNQYKNLNKKVVVFLISDFVKKLNIPNNVFLFRTSLYKSNQQKNEYLLPYIWEGFNESFTGLEKTEKPIVGFCGTVKNNTGKRQSCINKLTASNCITPNFITKQSFWGGNPHDATLIEDFKTNILHSHLTLSNRGAGNFSMRFYQVLSLGRIPVLLDSDMVFPFEDQINWDEVCIKAKTEKELIAKIPTWWKSRSNDEVKQIQLRCKKIYDDFIQPKSFGNRITSFLIEHKNDVPRLENKNILKSLFQFFRR
jgi:hypothetical protein